MDSGNIRIDAKTRRSLRDVGEPALVVRRTRKGRLVFYVWQAFAVARLTENQALDFAESVLRAVNENRKKDGPLGLLPKPIGNRSRRRSNGRKRP